MGCQREGAGAVQVVIEKMCIFFEKSLHKSNKVFIFAFVNQ